MAWVRSGGPDLRSREAATCGCAPGAWITANSRERTEEIGIGIAIGIEICRFAGADRDPDSDADSDADTQVGSGFSVEHVMLPKVVLYNPRAVFWTMPLALIAVGSALDRSKYDVTIVDGRLETDPVRSLAAHIDEQTVCLGITVLTGAPIRDALDVSRAATQLRPGLPIVWGGWHPSLFPEQCLSEPSIDAVVIGQGEVTFAEMVDRLASGRTLEGLSGCAFRANDGSVAIPPPRPMSELNRLPAHNYRLINVESYLQRKEHRQFDYISSQGCRFRCAFCADPTVYKRGWSGLAPERIALELSAHKQTYGFKEVAFQDETFFTNPSRVKEIAAAFLANGLTVDWTATMRSDQGSRLDDQVLDLCKRSGLKRVIIGVESGSATMLSRIHKDITLEQVFGSASKCVRHGIGAILNFIVGFPGETDEEIRQTLDVAARLRAMSPDFEASIFYFRPYPGTRLAEDLARDGHQFAQSLESWADFDYIGGRERSVSDEMWKEVERFKFYQRYAFGRDRLTRWPLRFASRWRIDKRFYRFPLEKALIETLKPLRRLS